MSEKMYEALEVQTTRARNAEAEIAKLREQLEITEKAHVLMTKTCGQWMRRAGAAEAKLKAASGQEPVTIEVPEYHDEAMGCGIEDRGITDRYEAARYGWDEALTRMFEQIPDEPLYAAPIPPADVQELQRALDCIQALHDIERTAFKERIAELEHKLAEQQAVFFGRQMPEETVRLLAARGFEELASLLAAEYQRGYEHGAEAHDSQVTNAYQRGRADERAEAEKEEPIWYCCDAIDSEGLNYDEAHVLVTKDGLIDYESDDNYTIRPLYTRQLAQKPLSEEARLLFVLNSSAFVVSTISDSGSRVFQLLTQNEDEDYICLHNKSSFFASEIEAVDAAIETANGITEKKEG